MLSLAVIFINVLVAANEIPENYEGPVSTILIFLNILVIVIITGENNLNDELFDSKSYVCDLQAF